jgi:DNA repair exonuclease SbcCD ATPase subunit
MLKKSLFLILALLIPSAAKAQSPSSDSQYLHDLLAEVHQLRHELQTTTVALQRSQILLHRLDLQENAVNRATERRDAAQAKLTELQDTRKEMAAFVKQGDDQSDNNNKSADDANARQGVMMMIPQMKARLQSLDDDEQQAQIKLTEAEEQLRLEQAKLGELESQLDRLDKSLEDSARQ